jgi:hypothetical protein
MERKSEWFSFIPNHQCEWKLGVDLSAIEFRVKSQRNGRKMREIRASVIEQKINYQGTNGTCSKELKRK